MPDTDRTFNDSRQQVMIIFYGVLYTADVLSFLNTLSIKQPRKIKRKRRVYTEMRELNCAGYILDSRKTIKTITKGPNGALQPEEERVNCL
jgi:archaellum component FlaF (FlaF/FlaG flagellin family)